ncbi:MAG: HTH-type transcriptional regulator MalR [Nitrosomonadaceae bacterium]|nr:HTH-type transcriptional regulator MalR [Nitrosomonadaceae bacterium]
MRTIAQAVGVAVSTVSRALRDDSTITVERRREIQKTAKSLGYTPNPLVANLMAQLHVQRRRTDPHHIAWIDLWPSDDASANLQLFKPLLQGARMRARELGYGIEVHKPLRDGINRDRLRQILVARSQWGLVIPPVPESQMYYSLDLQGLAAVTIGTSLHQPVMHRISPNLYQGSQLACQELRELGFRRIGFAISHSMNKRVEGKWLGAYLAEQQQWLRTERLPPLLIANHDAKSFRIWQSKCLPDAILIAEPQFEEWLTANSPRPPPTTAWLLLEKRSKKMTGIDYRGESIGAAAIEMVVGQIHRNERGSPEIPNTLLMDGIWVEP